MAHGLDLVYPVGRFGLIVWFPSILSLVYNQPTKASNVPLPLKSPFGFASSSRPQALASLDLHPPVEFIMKLPALYTYVQSFQVGTFAHPRSCR